jgi:hypothetical protein
MDRYWLPRWLMAGSMALCIYILATAKVLPHQAPSGWQYPPECCSNQDCKPMADSDIPKPLDGGAWLLRSGEIVPRSKVKWSPDGHYHLCKLEWEPFTTYCLFVPPQGS